MAIDKYWSSSCPSCAIKTKCTTGDYRRIARWEHEDVLDRMQMRPEARRDLAAVHRRTVEHPFGTLKAWMGAPHFLTKTLPRVRTEMSLHVLAYNMSRMMRILGAKRLIEKMRALAKRSCMASAASIAEARCPLQLGMDAFAHSLAQYLPR